MADTFSKSSSAPSVYLQVADKICKSIVTGELAENDRLPTESQFAEQIGVNRLTVSRGYGALRQRGIITQRRGQGSFVSPDAARLLGLPPRRRLRNVAFVLQSNRLTDIPAHSQVGVLDLLFGVSQRFEGLAINVCHVSLTNTDAVDPKWVERFDAFISVDRWGATDALIEQARELDRPCVIALPKQLDWTDLDGVPLIGYDRHAATQLAMNHLIDSGYRRIACIGVKQGLEPPTKTEAFHAIMQKHRLDVPACWSIHAGAEIGSAYHAIRHLLNNKQPLPQAIFADTDYKALETIAALQAAGLNVPEDIAICGYDNIADGATSTPALTTIQTPRREAGYRAADMLLNWLPHQPTPGNVVLPSQLIVRQTTPRITPEK